MTKHGPHARPTVGKQKRQRKPEMDSLEDDGQHKQETPQRHRGLNHTRTRRKQRKLPETTVGTISNNPASQERKEMMCNRTKADDKTHNDETAPHQHHVGHKQAPAMQAEETNNEGKLIVVHEIKEPPDDRWTVLPNHETAAQDRPILSPRDMLKPQHFWMEKSYPCRRKRY